MLGLPIFATLGGIALLLFWNIGLPAVEVPDNAYSLVASRGAAFAAAVHAGRLSAGGRRRQQRACCASTRRCSDGCRADWPSPPRWRCAIFTWAGSGVTIVSMGGLLLPMLVKARYPEKFSIGLINGSGSLGLLFPPSLPVILYGIYAKTADRARCSSADSCPA